MVGGAPARVGVRKINPKKTGALLWPVANLLQTTILLHMYIMHNYHLYYPELYELVRKGGGTGYKGPAGRP